MPLNIINVNSKSVTDLDARILKPLSNQMLYMSIHNGYIDSTNGNWRKRDDTDLNTVFLFLNKSINYRTKIYLVIDGELSGANYYSYFSEQASVDIEIGSEEVSSLNGVHYYQPGIQELNIPNDAFSIGVLYNFHNSSIYDDYKRVRISQIYQDIIETKLNNYLNTTLLLSTINNNSFISMDGQISPVENENYQVSIFDIHNYNEILIDIDNYDNPQAALSYSSFFNSIYQPVYSDNVRGMCISLPFGKTYLTIPENAYYFAKTSKFNSFTDNFKVYGIKYEIADKLRNWSDKTWLCVGDSLTEHNLRAQIHYYDYVNDETGVNFLVQAQSGHGYVDADYFYQVFSNLSNVQFDFLTVWGSGNDMRYEYLSNFLGQHDSWEDALGNITDNGTSTICGYMNRAFDKFYEVAPLKKIGVVTPTPWKNGSYDISQLTDEETHRRLESYSEALVKICYKRGIPCLDLFHMSGLQPTNDAVLVEYFNENGVQDTGVHPNSKGNKWLSNMFKIFIEQYLIW